MKKLLKVALLGAVMAGLIIAGSGVSTTAPKEKYEFVFVHPGTGDLFIRPMVYGMKEAAKALGDIDVRLVGPVEFNIAAAVAHTHAAIEADVDGIFYMLLDPEAYDEVTQRAIDKGIPVIGTGIDDTTPNARLAFVGRGGVITGELMGQKMMEVLKKGDKVALFMHVSHILILEKLEGLEKVLDEHGVSYEEIVCGSEMTKALETVEAYLIGHPDVKGVYGMDGISTPACASALKAHPELWGKVHSGGMDLMPVTLEGIKKGYVDFTIDQQPVVWGYYPVVMLYLYQEFGMFPANIETGINFIDRSSDVDKIIEMVEKGCR